MPSFGQNAERVRQRLEEALTTELERRLAQGFDYDFGDSRGVHKIGTTAGDMKRWVEEVSPAAQALINLQQPEAVIGIKTDTGPVAITAAEWQQVLAAAMAFRQPIFQAYFALKASDPAVDDHTDDAHWPAVPSNPQA